jgi:hypothetical protein
MELTLTELYLIRESLEYTLRNLQNCTDYPSYEFKLARIAEARDILEKVRAQIREVKNASH